MKVEASPLSGKILKKDKTKLGELYFFENFVVSEIYEGSHVDIKSAQEVFKIIDSVYGENTPFGYISNRVNKFSISLLDSKKINSEMSSNLSYYCSVTYNHIDKMNADLEKKFCPRPFMNFSDLQSCVNWIEEALNKNKITR